MACRTSLHLKLTLLLEGGYAIASCGARAKQLGLTATASVPWEKKSPASQTGPLIGDDPISPGAWHSYLSRHSAVYDVPLARLGASILMQAANEEPSALDYLGLLRFRACRERWCRLSSCPAAPIPRWNPTPAISARSGPAAHVWQLPSRSGACFLFRAIGLVAAGEVATAVRLFGGLNLAVHCETLND